MCILTSEVSYTSATTGRGDHEVYKGHLVVLGKERREREREKKRKTVDGNVFYFLTMTD
jgi:hypothetical protein